MNEIYETARERPSSLSDVIVWHLGGAMSRVGAAETAFGSRSAPFLVNVEATWTDPADTDRCIAWARETYQQMEPFAAAGRYVNYLGDDEPGDPVAAAYGPNYRRLRELKTKYDPKNFFRMNQNIRPLV